MHDSLVLSWSFTLFFILFLEHQQRDSSMYRIQNMINEKDLSLSDPPYEKKLLKYELPHILLFIYLAVLIYWRRKWAYFRVFSLHNGGCNNWFQSPINCVTLISTEITCSCYIRCCFLVLRGFFLWKMVSLLLLLLITQIKHSSRIHYFVLVLAFEKSENFVCCRYVPVFYLVLIRWSYRLPRQQYKYLSYFE